jgi:ABC-type glycerol-3-phosphate transport system permease component
MNERDNAQLTESGTANKAVQAKMRKLPLFIFMLVIAAIWLLPIIATFLIAFKSPADFISSKFYELPKQFFLMNNLNKAFEYYRFYINMYNSFIYAIVGTLGCIIAASLAGFSIEKLRPKFNFLLFMIIYSGTIFPFQMYLIPLYKIYNTVGLYNTQLGMNLLYTAICTPFALFVFRGYYQTIDDSLIEAAKIDGCGPIRMYLKIFLPLLKVPIAVVAVFQGMWIWNDLLFGMVLSQTDEIRPIMVAITSMAGSGGGNVPLLMTGVIFTSIPTILLFIALRKYFIQGYTFS